MSHGLSPDDKNKSHKTDGNPSPPQEYNKYANITNATPAIRLLHARDSRLSIMVSNQSTEHNAPTLSTPVSRKLFGTSTEVREGAQHESTTASHGSMRRIGTNAPTQSTPVYQKIPDNAPTVSAPESRKKINTSTEMRYDCALCGCIGCHFPYRVTRGSSRLKLGFF